MARAIHSEGLRERRRMRNTSRAGKWDIGAREPDGTYTHITRLSDKAEAEARLEELSDIDEETRKLIGLPDGEYELEINEA